MNWSDYPNFSEAEFRCVRGYEDKYFVSADGRVLSFAYGELKERALVVDAKGYFVVTLYSKNVGKQVKVHRLVAEAFIPNPEGKRTVNHKNGNKQDNCISNLEWATHGENKSHSFTVLGEKHWLKGKHDRNCPFSKIVEQIDLRTRKPIATFFSSKAAHAITGISQGNIGSVCRGQRSHAGGFLWRYVNV